MTERRDNEPLASPFEPMLRGREMPSVFVEEFMLPLDGSHDALLEGSMDRVWSVRWARPLLGLLSRWDVLFPETLTNVPTTMHIFVGRDRNGRLCHHWNRTFVMPNVTRRIDAHLVWEPDREWVAEWMGPGGCFEMAWHVRFLPPDAVEVNARLEALRFGWLRVPLPRPLQVDAHTVDTADPRREDVLHCALRLTSPVLGPICGYEGTFRLRRITRDEGRRLASSRKKVASLDDRQQAHARWLKAAALYNVVWGTANVLWPKQALRRLGATEFVPSSAWRTVGMMVAAFSPAYWWAAQDPRRRAPIVAVGLLGHVLGPLGFLWALMRKRLPLRFGLTILSNDLLWLPAFTSIVRDAAVGAGGWRAFVAGKSFGQ